MTAWRVLVAGVGNIFLSDDAFGSEVARALEGCSLPEGVRVCDYGIGGVHLAHDIVDGVATLILIDTVPSAGPPGEVAVFEVAASDVDDGTPVLDAHSLDPAAVLASVRHLGGTVPRTLVVGCRPATLDEGLGMSPPLQAAVKPARQAVLDLIEDELQRGAT